MKRDIICVVEGAYNQEERLSSGWRLVSCGEVKEGGALRDEAIILLSDSKVASPVGSAYRLRDGRMYGKTKSTVWYSVVDGSGHDNDEDEMEFALMTKHNAVNLKIFRANNLNKVDHFESCNPFVVIWLINRHCRIPHGYVRADYNSLTKREKGEFIVFQQETTVKLKTLNPVWNEGFYIYICPSDEILLLDVYDWSETKKNKCLGRAVAEGICEAEKNRMDDSWENPFEIELSSIVGTIAFPDKPSKLLIGYNVLSCSNDACEDAPAQREITEQLTNQNELLPQSPDNDESSQQLDSNEPPQLYDNNETPQSSGNDETHQLPDNNVTSQSVYNNETREILQPLEDNETSQSHDNNEASQNSETPLQPDNDEIPEPHDNDIFQSHSETLESSDLDQSIDGHDATYNGSNLNESNNNDSLDSSYYLWQNIMQRFKDLPFDEPNMQRIQREITEFYRRSMRNGIQVEQPELPSESAVDGAVGGTEQAAFNPSSLNYEARYEAAAAKLTSGERLMLQIIRDTRFEYAFDQATFRDAFKTISKIPQDRIHVLRAPIYMFPRHFYEDGRYGRHNDTAQDWFSFMSKTMFNPHFRFFEYSAYDNRSLQINPKSGVWEEYHLEIFKFIGQVTGMAVFHQKLLDVFIIRPFYKMMLGKPITLSDFEVIDYEYFQSLQWIRDNDPYNLELKFSVDEPSPGQRYMIEKDLIPNGRNVSVTEQNKHEYIEKIVEWSINSRIKEQMDSFMEGFNDVIPVDAIKIFDAGELELLISGHRA